MLLWRTLLHFPYLPAWKCINLQQTRISSVVINKVYRKDQIDIALLLISDKARRLWIHVVNIDFFIINDTECIDQQLRIEANLDIFAFQCEEIFSSITSSAIFRMIGRLSPSFTIKVARSIQSRNSFLLIVTFVS